MVFMKTSRVFRPQNRDYIKNKKFVDSSTDLWFVTVSQQTNYIKKILNSNAIFTLEDKYNPITIDSSYALSSGALELKKIDLTSHGKALTFFKKIISSENFFNFSFKNSLSQLYLKNMVSKMHTKFLIWALNKNLNWIWRKREPRK